MQSAEAPGRGSLYYRYRNQVPAGRHALMGSGLYTFIAGKNQIPVMVRRVICG